jgi:hypothetical protein
MIKYYRLINYIILVTVGILLSAGCTNGFEEINKDPYGVTKDEASRDAYSESAAMLAIQSWVIPTFPNACQFTECLLGGNWGGYFSDSNPGFNGKNFATYRPEPDWNKVLFTDIITNIYPNYRALKDVTDEEILLSVAEICKVAALHRITDAYGPIPYSKIGENGELNAPFDSQEQVYRTMFKELTDAVDILTIRQAESFSPNADKVFNGNIVAWIKFANSLKLRLAMRLAYVDPDLAQQMAEEAVAHEVGVMKSNADNARIGGFGKDGNPLHRIMYLWNGGDSRVSADITSYMNGFQDPRREKYFTQSTFTANDNVAQNGYFGLRSGIMIPAAQEAQKYANYNVTPNTPMLWMNAAEVAFLRAEGALRGWNMGAESAEDCYEQGIRLSFEEWGAGGVDSYLADNVRTPSPYIDPMGKNTYSGKVSNITVAWKEDADFEENLERIITQKWIAIFPLGLEAWAEHRRTGYPFFMPVVVNNSGGVVNTDLGPRRLAYPGEEITTNGENVRYAIDNYLKGPDNMATHVWWDAKK